MLVLGNVSRRIINVIVTCHDLIRFVGGFVSLGLWCQVKILISSVVPFNYESSIKQMLSQPSFFYVFWTYQVIDRPSCAMFTESNTISRELTQKEQWTKRTSPPSGFELPVLQQNSTISTNGVTSYISLWTLAPVSSSPIG